MAKKKHIVLKRVGKYFVLYENDKEKYRTWIGERPIDLENIKSISLIDKDSDPEEPRKWFTHITVPSYEKTARCNFH